MRFSSGDAEESGCKGKIHRKKSTRLGVPKGSFTAPLTLSLSLSLYHSLRPTTGGAQSATYSASALQPDL